MNWTLDKHGTYSSEHQQKGEKEQLAQAALCDNTDPRQTFERRGG